MSIIDEARAYLQSLRRPSLSPEDEDRIARTAIGEAGAESDEGVAAVIHAIKNRLGSGRFGASVQDVTRPSQFNAWADPKGPAATTPPQSPGYQRAVGLVKQVFAGEMPDPTGGATHFYSPANMPGGKEPSWAPELTPVAEIGGHRFFREGKPTQVAADTGPKDVVTEAREYLRSLGAEGNPVPPSGGSPRLTDLPDNSRTPDGSLVVRIPATPPTDPATPPTDPATPPTDPTITPLSETEQQQALAETAGAWPGVLRSANDVIAGIAGFPGDVVFGVVGDGPAADYPLTTDWIRKQGAKVGVTHSPGVRLNNTAGFAGRLLGNSIPAALAVPGLATSAAISGGKTAYELGTKAGLPAFKPTYEFAKNAAGKTTVTTPLAQRAADITANFARSTLAPHVAAPAATAIAETGIAVASGAAGKVARDNAPPGYEDLAQVSGEVLAGAVIPAVGAAAGSAWRATADARDALKVVPGVSMVIRGVRALKNFALQSDTARARDRVRAMLDDPESAVSRLETGDGDKVFPDLLPPSAVLDSDALMGLERGILKKSPQIAKEVETHIQDSYRETHSRIWGDYQGAGTEPVAQTVARYRATYEAQAHAAVKAAEARAAEAAKRIGGGNTPEEVAQLQEQASLAFRAELDTADKVVQKNVDAVWAKAKAAGIEMKVRPGVAADRYVELMESLPEAQRHLMPPMATKYLAPPPGPKVVETQRVQTGGRWGDVPVPEGGFGGTPLRPQLRADRTQVDHMSRKSRVLRMQDSQTYANREVSIYDLQGLRSELLTIQRNALAGTGATPANPAQARIAGSLADALLDDMGVKVSAAGDDTAAGLLKQALEASRVYRQTFDRGPIGTLLGRLRTGAEAVPPELSLTPSRLSGAVGAVNVKRALDAVRLADQNGDAALLDSVDQYLRTQFRVKVIDPETGFAKKKDWESFQNTNNHVLQLRPQLRAEFDEAAKLGAQALAVSEKKAADLTDFQSPAKEVTAFFINKDPDQAIPDMLKGKLEVVRANFADMRARTDEDPTGEATKGLKEAFTTYMFRTARATKGPSEAEFTPGVEGVEPPWALGRKLASLMREPNVEQAMKALFSADEIRRWQVGANSLMRLDRYVAANPDLAASKALASTLETLASQVLGARAGTHVSEAFGIGGIQMQAIGSKLAKGSLEQGKEKAFEAIVREALLDREKLILLLERVSPAEAARRRRIAAGWLYGNIAAHGFSLGDEDSEAEDAPQ